jgi:hypothetical protein
MPVIEFPFLIIIGLFTSTVVLIILAVIFFQFSENLRLHRLLLRAVLIFALLAAGITLLLSCPLSLRLSSVSPTPFATLRGSFAIRTSLVRAEELAAFFEVKVRVNG